MEVNVKLSELYYLINQSSEDISDFWRTIFNGCSLRSLMVCAWKYDLNLLAKTLSMQIPFSLSEDTVYLPREELYC